LFPFLGFLTPSVEGSVGGEWDTGGSMWVNSDRGETSGTDWDSGLTGRLTSPTGTDWVGLVTGRLTKGEYRGEVGGEWEGSGLGVSIGGLLWLEVDRGVSTGGFAEVGWGEFLVMLT
jgi:hypothetical protein